MSGLYRECNKPEGEAFHAWYAAKCERPVDLVECCDGTWSVRRYSYLTGGIRRDRRGYRAQRYNATSTRLFSTFLHAVRYAAIP